MYRVRFFVNNQEIKPYIDYKTQEMAKKAGELWVEEVTINNKKYVYTYTIEKL